MIDCKYWKKVVDKLIDAEKANWSAHVLASNLNTLDEILNCVDKEIFIKNCLLCYSLDFSAQPYLDEILSKFSSDDLLNAYKKLEKKPLQTAGALMWLLEDMDPTFKCITNN